MHHNQKINSHSRFTIGSRKTASDPAALFDNGSMTIRLKDNLRRLLMTRGIRAADLARQTGIAPSVLSEWMSGRMPRNISHLWKIAKQLQVSVDDLCFEETEILLRKEKVFQAEAPARTATAKAEDVLAIFPITLKFNGGQEFRLSAQPVEPEPGISSGTSPAAASHSEALEDG